MTPQKNEIQHNYCYLGWAQGTDEKANSKTRKNNQDVLRRPGVPLHPLGQGHLACPKSRSVRPESSPID
jgi:hypothetical protein